MRIVFLNPGGALGGAEMSLLDAVAGLKAERPGWALHLIAGGEGPLLQEAASLGASAEVLALPGSLARLGDAGASPAALLPKLAAAGLPAAAYARRLRRRLRELAPTVVDTHGFKMHILGRWAKPDAAGLLWHVHDYMSSRPIMARLMRACAGPDTTVVGNSKSVARDAAAVCPRAAKVVPIYYGIDLDRFSPEGPSAALAAMAGLPEGDPGALRAGLVATMARWKGHEVFLKALSLLSSVRGYIVGGPIYQTEGSQRSLDELKALTRELGLSDRVGFTGFTEEPAEALRALDVVVHASTKPEPFGRVIIEGMACGRAVVASPLGGAAELVEDGIDALTCVPGDARSLAAAISKLAADPKLRKRLGEAGRRKALEGFGRPRMARELVPIYEELAGRRRP